MSKFNFIHRLLFCFFAVFTVIILSSSTDLRAFTGSESSIDNQQSSEIPKSLLPQVVETLGSANSQYHILQQKGTYTSKTPGHGIVATFNNDQVVFERGQNTIGMRLISKHANITPKKVSDNRIEYHRGNITEWYVNSPYGVEQGFTLKSKPNSNEDKVTLNVGLELNEDVKAVDSENGKSIQFVNSDDNHILNYSGLYAFDSTGKELPSSLSLKENDIIQIDVDDRNAQYPITIDPFIEAQRVTAADPTSGGGDDFAWCVSIDGDRAIVGIPGWDGAAGSGQGAAIIYERNGSGVWVATPTLLSPNPTSFDDFGMAVSISGDWALIGEPDDSAPTSGDGSAHFFQRVNGVWTIKQTVSYTTDTLAEDFGFSVYISGDRAIIGDPLFGTGGTNNAGAAFVYERSGSIWNGVAANPIIPSDTIRNAEFGFAVSIFGDWFIVGAPGDNNNALLDTIVWGAVYFYQRTGPSTWAQLQKVIGTPDSELGASVSMDGSIAIAGAFGEAVSGSGVDTGAVYVFERNGTDWTIGSANPDVTTTETRIAASDPNATDRFGTSVSIFGDMVVIGSTGQDIGEPAQPGTISNSGSAYIYQRTAPGVWGNEQELFASDPSTSAIFGQSVSISGDTILVGSPQADDVAAEQGAGYFFDLSAMLTIEKETNPDGGTDFDFSGTGFSATCGLNGSFTLDDNDSAGTSFIDCDVLPGSYTVQETNPNGHVISDINCVGTSDFIETPNSVTVNLISDDQVVCTFTNSIQHTLTVTKSGSGTGTVTTNPSGIDCGNNCSADFNEGAIVTMVPVAAEGSVFVEFTGAGCTSGAVTINTDTTCDAVFDTSQVAQFSLNIAKNGTGEGTVTSTPAGINCGSTCTASFNEDTVVTLSPLPSIGSEFAGWSGNADCSDGIVTMSAARTCTATFNLLVVSSINLLPLNPSQVGVQNTLTATGATPNGQVRFIWGFNQQIVTAEHICPGLEAGILNPRNLVTVTANGAGTASFTFNMPKSVAGVTLVVQAIDLTPCEGSNVTTETIANPPVGDPPVLNALNPGTVGQNTLTSTGHTPGGQVRIIYGFHEELTNGSAICAGLQVGIRNFRNLTTVTANGSGNVSLAINVPQSIVGGTVKLQTVDISSCTPSNLTTETF